MTAHVVVDETKEKGHLVTAAVVLSGDLVAARRTMRGLIMATNGASTSTRSQTRDESRFSMLSSSSHRGGQWKKRVQPLVTTVKVV